MNETITRIAQTIVSCGILHRFPFAQFLGSLLFVPLLFLIRFAHTWMPDATLIGIISIGLISLIAFYIVLTEPAEMYPVLILDKIYGLLIAFITIPMQLKLVFIGFLTYHIIRIITPFLSKRLFNFDFYNLGNVLHFLLPSFLSGIIVNILLQLILWAAR